MVIWSFSIISGLEFGGLYIDPMLSHFEPGSFICAHISILLKETCVYVCVCVCVCVGVYVCVWVGGWVGGCVCVCVCVCLHNWTNLCPYGLNSTPIST